MLSLSLFFFFLLLPLRLPVDQRETRSRDRKTVVSQNGPRRDIVLARTFARGKVPWENARDRNAEEKGVSSRSARTPAYVCAHHTLAFRVAPRPPLSVRWCGKSVVLTGTRWSTTLKAVVAVKEEGRRAGARVQGEAGSRWRGGGGGWGGEKGEEEEEGGGGRRSSSSAAKAVGSWGWVWFEGGLIVWYHDVFNLQAAIWS